MTDPETLLKLENGKIADYSTVRERVFAEMISYYGAAGGGPWVGFLGVASLYLTLAALGNVVALCSYQGLIPERLATSILNTLRDIHVDVKKATNPF